MIYHKKCLACKKVYIIGTRQNFKKQKYCSRKCQSTQPHTWIRKDIKFWEHCKHFKWKTATEEEKKQRVKDRFEKYVIRQDGCWDWKGCIHKSGYAPMNYYNNQFKNAHVVSWILHKGNIPNGLCVLHKCDNRKCTNPEHLFLGTYSDNHQDMLKKHRNNTQKGEKSHLSKLKEYDVVEIRNLISIGVPMTKIAKRYNVTYCAIRDIKRSDTWKV